MNTRTGNHITGLRGHVALLACLLFTLLTPAWGIAQTVTYEIAQPAAAERAEPLQIRLEVFVVTISDDGAEVLVAGETAKPGDTLEYKATYTNSGPRALRGVSPEIPVPAALVYLPGTDEPAAEAAQIADKGFQKLPALDDQGRPFAPELIRALRWSAADLLPDQVRTVRFRAALAR